MMHKQPHKDTLTPGAQVDVNLEKPLSQHIADFLGDDERLVLLEQTQKLLEQARAGWREERIKTGLQRDEIDKLRGRVQEAETELSRLDAELCNYYNKS